MKRGSVPVTGHVQSEGPRADDDAQSALGASCAVSVWRRRLVSER